MFRVIIGQLFIDIFKSESNCLMGTSSKYVD